MQHWSTLKISLKMRPEWIVLIIGTVLRVIAAYWNAYIKPLIGSEYDAQGFHNGALNIANKAYTAYSIEQSYMYFLGFIYRFTGVSTQFFGSLISCTAWFLSTVVLIQILNELDITKQKIIGIIFYVLLPSSIVYTSLTMREPFMLLAINCIVLSLLNLSKHNEIYLNGFILILFSVIIVLLNISFITCIAFIMTSILIIKFTKNKSINYILLIASLSLCLYFLITILPLYEVYENNIIDIINARQNHFQKFARASYDNGVITDSMYSFAKFIVISFINYMIQPIEISKMIFKDYLLLLENLIRIGMFFLALIALIKSMVLNNIKYIFLFFTYLIIELTWASYTINWGTAVRHHLPSFGILTVLSIYAVNFGKNAP